MESAPANIELTFIRARKPEQKQQRSTAILEAARRLALRDGVGAVSLGTIAADVGMHKTALLKYFGTREEIFLRLAEEEWRNWAATVVDELSGVQVDDTRLVSALATSFTRRPLFCQLLTYSALTLERNVSLEAVRRSKRAALNAASQVADAIHSSVPALSRSACLELTSMTGVTAAGLWQIAHPPPVILELNADSDFHPHGGPGLTNFDDAVSRFIRVYLDGLRHTS